MSVVAAATALLGVAVLLALAGMWLGLRQLRLRAAGGPAASQGHDHGGRGRKLRRSRPAIPEERTTYATYDELGLRARPVGDEGTAHVALAQVQRSLAGPEATEQVTLEQMHAAAAMAALAPGPRERAPVLLHEAFDPERELAQVSWIFAEWQAAMTRPGRDLQAIATGPEWRWLQALDDLSQPMPVLRYALKETLHAGFDATPAARKTVAALALLEAPDIDGLGLVRERLAEVDGDRGERRALELALSLWPNTGNDARLRQAAEAEFSSRSLRWAERLLARGVDPGRALIERYLGASDRRLIMAGLELLAVHGRAREQQHTVEHWLFHKEDPELRQVALEAGLRLGLQSAWHLCRQLSTDAEHPRATELRALLAERREQLQLIDWANRDAAPHHALWAMGLTGRPKVVEIALARIDDVALGPLAMQSFVRLTGYRGPPEQASFWWGAQQQQQPARGRILIGRRYDAATVASCLASFGDDQAEPLVRELLMRAPTRPRILLRGLARDLLRQLISLSEVGTGLDFTRGFPWT